MVKERKSVTKKVENDERNFMKLCASNVGKQACSTLTTNRSPKGVALIIKAAAKAALVRWETGGS